MPDSVRKRVVASVVTALEQINGPIGGYNYDLTVGQRVYDWGRPMPEIHDRPVILVVPATETIAQTPGAGFHSRLLTVTLTCAVRSGDRQNAGAAAEDLLHDVEKALMVDYQRGGLAHDTVITGVQMMISEAELPDVVFVATLNVSYRNNVYDPSSTAKG